ncbi:MAG: hypothetical protein HYV07_22390 [Deltaproteobacteria bacterium]|nr:hypothetical protein [Deltaproteobacteria bacterium]
MRALAVLLACGASTAHASSTGSGQASDTTNVVLTTELLAEPEDEPGFDGVALREAVRATVEAFLGARAEWATDSAFSLERCGASSECRISRLREFGGGIGIDVVVDVRTRPWVFTVQVVAAKSGLVEDELVEVPRERESETIARIRHSATQLLRAAGLSLGGRVVVTLSGESESAVVSVVGMDGILEPGRPTALLPGRYEVQAESPTGAYAEAGIVVTAGATTDVTLALVRPEGSSSWVWWALSGVALVAGGVATAVVLAIEPPATAVRICQAPQRAMCE